MLIAGTGCRVITPDKPLALAGYAARWGQKSAGVHDDIFAKALYISNETEAMLLLFADVEGLPASVLAPVRARIADELGIQQVSASATHNHSAPHTYPQIQLEQEEANPAWVAFLQRQLFAAARDAISSSFPASIGCGMTTAPEIAHNRRKWHGTVDSSLAVLAVRDKSDIVRAILVTYSCHCTVLDGTSFLVSADYPGYLYQKLNVRFPEATVVFSNGAAGDTNIGYSSDASALGERMDIRTFENAERVANVLAERTLTCLESLAYRQDMVIGMTRFPLLLPLRPDLPTERQLWERIHTFDQQIAVCNDDEALRSLKLQKIYQQCFVLRLHTNRAAGPVLSAEGVAFRFGSRLYVTIPGELFAESGLALKSMFLQACEPVILGYSNGYVGYLPSEEAMLEGGYESETSIFRTDVAEAAIRQAVDAVLRTGWFPRS